MTKKILAIFISVLTLSCTQKTPETTRLPLTRNLIIDLNSLLPVGKSIVDIMDGIKNDDKIQALSEKLKKGVSENYDWFLDFQKALQPGQKMPYHPNLGMTEKEYAELMGYYDQIEAISTGKEELEITRTDDTYSFKTSGKLNLLNSLTVNPSKNEVLMGGRPLTKFDTVYVADGTNAFKSSWRGYKWTFEEPTYSDLEKLRNPETVNMKSIKLTLGRLDNSTKTLLIFSVKEVKNGQRTINVETPIIF
ncbi:MAG: hypothetical protein CFE21_09235 [Bacteroidetes bacterium B1(2017)]|nr:MAG: hypothetical protein CFE21_09235 [Bacteroidetes bacterium B1(2017)]